jgi:Fe2+ transport system protein FeoA
MAVVILPRTECPSSATLAELPAGACGRIESVDLPNDAAERLEGMGICLGRTVRLVRCGEPNIVHVYGTRIGLAAAVARQIRVSLAP